MKKKSVILLSLLFLSIVASIIIPAIFAETKYESYETTPTAIQSCRSIYWNGLNFSASSTHTVTIISLNGYRVGYPGTITVQLQLANTTTHFPYGSALTSGTYNGSTLPDSGNNWFNVSVTEYAMTSGIEYAIVVDARNGNNTNYFAQSDKLSLPPYNGLYSGDSGATWSLLTRDYLFIIYGNPPAATDTEPPKYSNIAYNTTYAGQPCKFSCLWTDNVSLSGYIFGTNNSGSFTNDTWVSFGSSNNSWANVTKTLTSSISVVQFRWWANDTTGNWNNTEIQTLTTTGWNVTIYIDYFGSYGGEVNLKVLYNGTFASNGTTLSYPNSTSILTLSACPPPYPTRQIFTAFYMNGTKAYTLEGINVTGVNPISFTVNASFIIIANFTDRIWLVPILEINATSSYVNQTILFNASKSYVSVYDPIKGYIFDYGDGDSSGYTASSTATHKYATAGLYNITLTVYVDPMAPIYADLKFYSITITDPPEDTSWYIAPGFILGLVCFMALGFVFVKKRRD